MNPQPTTDAGDKRANDVSWVEREVARLAELPLLERATCWFAEHAQDLVERQVEITAIPAPPFGERARAEWLAACFNEIGLGDVHLDAIGNVLAIRPGSGLERRYLAITAHLDTVFPPGTALNVRREGPKLFGPGVSDNGAGITALLGVASALQASAIQTILPVVFIGNVGEEGEGDVRGMRHLFADPHWRDAIEYTLVIDGAGTDTIVTEALGSRRFQVTVRGPGGHSWSDFGVVNPVVVLARAIEMFARTTVPSSPKTTFNIGHIEGGTSVNSIPQSASMKVDIRSAAAEQIDRLERALHEALERSIVAEPRHAYGGRAHSGISVDVDVIGDRPAARLSPNSRMLSVVQGVDVHLKNTSRLQRASTDANIPLSQGREAVAIGAGGTGGGAHTLQEWYDPTGRELGLRRILLSALALAGAHE